MGASGYEDHIVVCGWNSHRAGPDHGARRRRVQGQDRRHPPLDKNPAGDGVYFVKGDHDRPGRSRARRASSRPPPRWSSRSTQSNDADMRSILTVMAIESVAPDVRTVAEVNNPRHVDHFRRAHVDEMLVSSRSASRLLARSALYPGLTELVDRHRVRRRRLGAVPGRDARRLPRPVRRRGERQVPRRSPRHAVVDQPRTEGVRQPAVGLPTSPATTRWWWPSRSGRSPRSS